MSALLAHLKDRIAREGPLTVAQYMEVALAHPEHGYYMGRDPFGRGGDFITAPEVSQMFGELVGLWCAAVWQSMGAPAGVRLVELGPGRGTLMADLLRATRGVEGFPGAGDVHLVETSPALRAHQKESLGEGPTWHDDFSTVPEGPLLVVANEFFDALPIHQYAFGPEGWRERLVNQDARTGALCFLPGAAVDGPEGAEAGAVWEASPASTAVARSIAKRIATHGGGALIIDYGHARSGFGDTLQAVKDHAYHGVLDDPGEADLTAHVDFQALAGALSEGGAVPWGPLPQGVFLSGLGIAARAAVLLKRATAEQSEAIAQGHDRLTASDQMGMLFKVLAATHPSLPAPPPFE